MNLLERCFKLKENNTTMQREIYTGVVTFLSVSYILAVNPAILSTTGMDKGGVFYATAIAAFLGTIAMSFIANYPLVLAPAMGLNAFFAYSVVAGMGYSWQFALFAVVVEGVVFFLLSLSPIREMIVNAIPMPLKYAMGSGIGLFITMIALKNAYIITDHPETLLSRQDFCGPDFHTSGISALLAMAGVLLSAYLMRRKVMGALLFGIIGTWLIGIVCQLTGVYQVDAERGFYSLIPHFDLSSFTDSLSGFCSLFGSAFNAAEWKSASSGASGWKLLLSMDFVLVCFAFLFTDFFDTIGSVNGAIVGTPLMKADGKIPRLKKLLLADSIATFAGGVIGTSTTTTFAESAVGIRAGARTGLSSFTAAVLFLVSLTCAPLFLALPGFSTAPALIIIGFLMMSSIIHIQWDDIASALPAYLLLTGIVFTYNISDGLGFGIISYTLLNCRIKGRVNWLMWLISALFVTKYVFL